jgi:hypothetical protein
MGIELRSFVPRDLLLAPPAAWEVLRFFFPGDDVGIYPEDLSVEDRLFAQALLVAAIDETRAMGVIEGPDETPLVASGWGRVRFIAARVAQAAPPEWFAHAAIEGADASRVHETARGAASARHRARWLAHVRGGPLL